MYRPVVVAITGSVPRKADNPALPVTVSEQIESTHAAYEAGATLAGIHVRTTTSPPPPIRTGSPPSRRTRGPRRLIRYR